MTDYKRFKRLKDMSFKELVEYEKYLKQKGCDPGPQGEKGHVKEPAVKK